MKTTYGTEQQQDAIACSPENRCWAVCPFRMIANGRCITLAELALLDLPRHLAPHLTEVRVTRLA